MVTRFSYCNIDLSPMSLRCENFIPPYFCIIHKASFTYVALLTCLRLIGRRFNLFGKIIYWKKVFFHSFKKRPRPTTGREL